MLGRRGHQLHATDLRRLPPIELLHLGRIHAPLDQPIAHAQRSDEMPHLGRQRQDGSVVQVVVMVVRQDHAFNGRQVFQADGRRMEALGAHPLHRRCALRKHRVGQPEPALKLHQQGRVPEPVQAAVGRGLQLGGRQRGHRHRQGRHGVGGLVEKKAPSDCQGLAPARRSGLDHVAKTPLLHLRRGAGRGRNTAGGKGKTGHDGEGSGKKGERVQTHESKGPLSGLKVHR